MFDLDKSIEDFLKLKKTTHYNNNITVFKQFLKEEIKVSDNAMQDYLNGIKTHVIIESLDYYIRTKTVTSKDTAKKYVSCMKEYFSYILHTKDISNKELAAELGYSSYSPMSYTFKVNNFIASDSRLYDIRGFKIFNAEEIKKLVKSCEKTSYDKDIIEKSTRQKKSYNKFRSAIIIRLIILTGIRYEVIPEIKKSDLNTKYNYLVINGYKIHLPDSFKDQFDIYEEILSKLGIDNEKREYLFLEFNGDKLSQVTSTTSSYMKDIIGRGDLNGLIKYTVTEMIKNETNAYVLKSFTSVGEKMYEECQDYALNKVNGYLDAKIRSLEIYDMF